MAGRLELAQSRAEPRVVEQRGAPVEVRDDEQRGPHAGRRAERERRLDLVGPGGETS